MRNHCDNEIATRKCKAECIKWMQKMNVQGNIKSKVQRKGAQGKSKS